MSKQIEKRNNEHKTSVSDQSLHSATLLINFEENRQHVKICTQPIGMILWSNPQLIHNLVITGMSCRGLRAMIGVHCPQSAASSLSPPHSARWAWVDCVQKLFGGIRHTEKPIYRCMCTRRHTTMYSCPEITGETFCCVHQ